jgi:hypothetical protein
LTLDRTFVTLTPDSLSKLVFGAKRRVIYAAPSLTPSVATALINARERLGADAVAIILDVSEGVLRLGYGVADAIAVLREKGAGIRDAPGLRISFIVIDDEGFVFALPPMLVEGDAAGENAVRASGDQIEMLVRAVLSAPSKIDGSAATTTTAGPPPASTLPAPQSAEIGSKMAPPAKIASIEEAIRTNPVENFDLKRIVNVFSPYFQFFELEIVNAQVERRTAQLPNEILASIRDKATRDRITAAFKMLSGDSKLSGEKIRKKAVEVRKRFVRHHPVYGGVILKSSQKELDSGIKELEQLLTDHKKSMMARFDKDAKKSIEALVKAFWRNVLHHPPQEMLDQGIGKPSTEQAKNYLRRKLTEALPSASDLAEKMEVKKVVKDITWNALNEAGFVDWLRRQWPDRADLHQPFDAYRAAAASAQMSGARGRR